MTPLFTGSAAQLASSLVTQWLFWIRGSVLRNSSERFSREMTPSAPREPPLTCTIVLLEPSMLRIAAHSLFEKSSSEDAVRFSLCLSCRERARREARHATQVSHTCGCMQSAGLPLAFRAFVRVLAPSCVHGAGSAGYLPATHSCKTRWGSCRICPCSALFFSSAFSIFLGSGLISVR